ncbi:MAG: MBL fold metallo-hydrolase [Patescibacteria group bacterium]
MEFTIKNSTITISSDKKEILLTPETVVLDGLDIALPGEYEKSGCLMYAWHKNDEKLYHFRTEGYWIAYIPTLLADISPEALDFLGSVDVLVMPGAKSMQTVLEKVEPRMIVTYGESAHEIATPLGTIEVVTKYKLKEADLSSEKTGCIVLG